MKIIQDSDNYYINDQCIPKKVHIGDTEYDHDIWYVSNICRTYFEEKEHTEKILKEYGY